jgi:hypothetical protein
VKWSKLRVLVRANFAPCLGERLDIHSAAYGACTCGHAWLTLDGTIIANFCTRAAANMRYSAHDFVPNNPMYQNQFLAYGELSRQDAYRACWELIHSLSIEQALAEDDPLIQSLAMVDKRLGKRRLREIDPASLHPLAARLHQLRMDAEGLRLPGASAA